MANAETSRRDNLIRGVIFGHAIGDALGFATEGLSKADVADRYNCELKDFHQIQAYGMRALLKPGMWTDDTSQMICILESIIEKRDIVPKDVARKLTRWLVDDGFGCGQLVYTVLSDPDYLLKPEEVARKAWEETGRYSAPNGAVMRTSVIGLWQSANLEVVAANAAAVSKITHADPRCIASCIAVSTAIAALIANNATTEEALIAALNHATLVEPEARQYISFDSCTQLESLDLDLGCSRGEVDKIGYTYTALAAGFWALQNAPSFEEGIVAIINEGGDADTNAAVAGALLGARFGYNAIPERWVNGLAEARYLHSEVDDLLKVL